MNCKQIKDLNKSLLSHDHLYAQSRVNIILMHIIKSINNDVFFDTNYLNYCYKNAMGRQLELNKLNVTSLMNLIQKYPQHFKVSVDSIKIINIYIFKYIYSFVIYF